MGYEEGRMRKNREEQRRNRKEFGVKMKKMKEIG